MKRRQFTASVATLAGLSTVFGQAAIAMIDQVPGTGNAEEMMARDRFETRLGQHFTIWGSNGTSLRLSDVKSAVPGHEKEQFHVRFDAPAGRVLPEGLYLLETNSKIEYFLHLMPGESIAGRQQMIATINLQKAA